MAALMAVKSVGCVEGMMDGLRGMRGTRSASVNRSG